MDQLDELIEKLSKLTIWDQVQIYKTPKEGIFRLKNLISRDHKRFFYIVEARGARWKLALHERNIAFNEPFEKVFEKCTEEIKTEILFNLDLFEEMK